jgi:hypothetical protein
MLVAAWSQSAGELKTETFDEFLDIEHAGSAWTFRFENGSSFWTDGTWRVLRARTIAWAAGDHGQRFGLDHEVDLVHEIRGAFAGRQLTSVDVDDLTGDLTLVVAPEYEVQIPITSAGYESYGFRLKGFEYVGAGGGDLHVVVPSDHAGVVEGHRISGGFGTSTPTWEPWPPDFHPYPAVRGIVEDLKARGLSGNRAATHIPLRPARITRWERFRSFFR